MPVDKIAEFHASGEPENQRGHLPAGQTATEDISRAVEQPTAAGGLPWADQVEPTKHVCSHRACLVYELGLCAELNKKAGTESNRHPDELPFESIVHANPARQTIFYPNKWSEFVVLICDGWAVSSILAADGRRQILSILLPGDIASIAWVWDPISACSIEAVTDVTYRKFKRSSLKAMLIKNPSLDEKLSKILSEDRAQADQLTLDLGRRRARERLARLIINLTERLTKRGLMRDQTIEFPLRQRHIADATGLTPIHVSKLLGDFQRANLIKIEDRSLSILDEAKLRSVADWR